MGSSRRLRIRKRAALTIGLLLSAGFYYFDTHQPLGVASGIAYVGVVAIGLLAQSRRLVVFFGLIGVVLTIAGYFASHPGATPPVSVAVTNRILSILALLAVSVTGYVLIHRQQRFDARLMELASTDGLTGLLNRRALLEQAERRVEEAHRYGAPLSALMMDVDLFKRINDRHGHVAGDTVLRAVADTAGACMRRTDYLGRYGGEEFLLICPYTDAAEAAILAERIREATAGLGNVVEGMKRKVTVSIGVAQLKGAEADLQELIDAADRGLYRAKRGGRNKVVIEGGHSSLLAQMSS